MVIIIIIAIVVIKRTILGVTEEKEDDLCSEYK